MFGGILLWKGNGNMDLPSCDIVLSHNATILTATKSMPATDTVAAITARQDVLTYTVRDTLTLFRFLIHPCDVVNYILVVSEIN